MNRFRRAAAVAAALLAATALVAVSVDAGSAAPAATGKLAPDLRAALAHAAPEQLVPAIVVLRTQLDRRALPPGGRRKRLGDVVRGLRDTAGRAQPGLRAALAAGV